MEKNKVLIVDDIPENIETISEMIKDFDIDVKTANGGKEAIELIDSFKPDVILLDLMMPHEKLGIAYPLEGIDPPTSDRIAHAEAILQEAL